MSISTIMGHLKDAKTDLCYRSLSNLKNQNVSPTELAQACRKLGWHCFQVRDRIYIAKTDRSLADFINQQTEIAYSEL
jgi:hypothetical protein